MDFKQDSERWHATHFYKKLIKHYEQALLALENGQPVNKDRFIYQDHAYTLETMKGIQFLSNCQEHQWSYDKHNYRCICCGQWRELEPVQTELPKEILLQIFSTRTPTINQKLRLDYLWSNAWSLLLKMQYNYPPHFCRVMLDDCMFVCVAFKSAHMTSFASCYRDNQRENPLSSKELYVKGSLL